VAKAYQLLKSTYMRHTVLNLAALGLAFVLSGAQALAVTIDLTTATTGMIDDVIFTRVNNQPTGTGVFNPFLTLQNSPIEQGYNTSGADVFDTKRTPQWNHDLRLGNLVASNGYYVFELDANEKGSGNIGRLLSIDNIMIYTSSVGSQTVTTFDANGRIPFADGTLRYALNNPNTPNTPMEDWVKIDATLGSTSGSGSSDLRVLIPTSYFAGALASDYVYFYNLNGVHHSTVRGTAAEAGFEEWRTITQSYSPGAPAVPDQGSTVLLISGALTLLVIASRRLR
jgi:hypothetical protein